MEWVTGVKLTTLPPDEIRTLVGVGQEAFLVQLLEIGFFHGEPAQGWEAAASGSVVVHW
jgi:predicted unusual protein kinase regulating ubiquinone biosynthesis (AarF/ABC1/UbiB family)